LGLDQFTGLQGSIAIPIYCLGNKES